MIEIKYFETVDSTNDTARTLNQNNVAILADYQLKGRGQRGNSWESEAHQNLTFSLAVAPQNLSITEQFYISKAISIAICKSIKEYSQIECQIKWPNDIYVGNKKIAGILIENDVGSSGAIKRSIIGVGLNVNQRIFTSNAPNPTSIAIITEKTYNRRELLTIICNNFENEMQRLALKQLSILDEKYSSLLYRKDGLYPFSDSAGPFIGKIVCIKPDGELIIEKSDGTQKGYLFKEIEFEI